MSRTDDRGVKWPQCHDGVTLYEPTARYGRYRLVWRDPLAGNKRFDRGFMSREEAELRFAETIAYVQAARTAAPAPAPAGSRPNGPVLDDLMAALERRWVLQSRSPDYRRDVARPTTTTSDRSSTAVSCRCAPG